MPIRPCEKARYPKDWPAIRARIRERAGDKCEWCGAPNHELITRTPQGWFRHGSIEEKWVYIVCTTAHLNHIPEDCRDENLAFLCQKCHNGYDAKHRAQGRKAREYEATPSLF